MTFHMGYFVTDWFDRLYGKRSYYMYIMTVYHILIPFWIVWFGFNHPMTFATINPSSLHSGESMFNYINLNHVFVAVTWAFIVVLLDIFFLYMLKWHFHHARVTIFKYTIDFLSWKAIGISEIVIFILSFISMPLREVMLFLSINTIQITIAYILMAKIPFKLGNVLMITVAWIFLLSMLLFPVFNAIITQRAIDIAVFNNATMAKQSMDNISLINASLR